MVHIHVHTGSFNDHLHTITRIVTILAKVEFFCTMSCECNYFSFTATCCSSFTDSCYYSNNLLYRKYLPKMVCRLGTKLTADLLNYYLNVDLYIQPYCSNSTALVTVTHVRWYDALIHMSSSPPPSLSPHNQSQGWCRRVWEWW